MSIYPVSDKKGAALREKMGRYGIHERDFEESFARSSGSGGQNVNKVSTCVFLKHRPTGLSVKCQAERSQALNRFLARRMLVDTIVEKMHGIAAAKKHAAEKLRRQKKRRSRRAKAKMLHEKRRLSEKKSLRRAVQDTDSF